MKRLVAACAGLVGFCLLAAAQSYFHTMTSSSDHGSFATGMESWDAGLVLYALGFCAFLGQGKFNQAVREMFACGALAIALACFGGAWLAYSTTTGFTLELQGMKVFVGILSGAIFLFSAWLMRCDSPTVN